MKAILKKLLRLFIFVSYPILIIGLVAIGALYFIRNRELADFRYTYDQARVELNKQNENKQVTIDDLRGEFQDLTSEVSSLRSQNEDLKDTIEELQISGQGTITGKILPFVTAGSQDFSQYQRVCAQSIANPNSQTCRTVSAIEQTYTLNVPVGKYNVYAEIFPTPAAGSAFSNYKAYYTTYIACVQTKKAAECNASSLVDAVSVEVKAGDTVTGVDPIDWQKQSPLL